MKLGNVEHGAVGGLAGLDLLLYYHETYLCSLEGW